MAMAGVALFVAFSALLSRVLGRKRLRADADGGTYEAVSIPEHVLNSTFELVRYAAFPTAERTRTVRHRPLECGPAARKVRGASEAMPRAQAGGQRRAPALKRRSVGSHSANHRHCV